MTLTVSDTLGKLIELKLRNGKFVSVEELLTESLLRLDDSDVPYFGEFEPGELERLVDAGLNSGTPVSVDDVFAALEAKSAAARAKGGA